MEKWWLQTYGCEMGTPVTDWNGRNLWQGTLNEESISNWAKITSSRAWNIILFYLFVVSSMWEKASIVDRTNACRTQNFSENWQLTCLRWNEKKSPSCKKIKWIEFNGLVELSRCWWGLYRRKEVRGKCMAKECEMVLLEIYVVDWIFYDIWWRHVETCSFISFGW